MKVISIVSAPRSGSTLLDTLLGSVDGVFSGGELRYLWERGVMERRRCGCGVEVPKCVLWSKVLSAPSLAHLDPIEVAHWQHSLARVRHTRRLLKAASSSVRDPQLSRLISTMTALYKETGRLTGARVIVDSSKRPADAALVALLPGIQSIVVHLVRDPRAVAYSWHRRKPEFDHESRPEMEQRNVVRVAANWLWHNEVASIIPRWMPSVPFLRVRYEDILTRPALWLARILACAGEPGPTPSIHDHIASLPPNHTVSGNPSRFITGEVELRLDNEWRSAMGAAAWSAATAISIPSLRKYGYTIHAGAPWSRSRSEEPL